MVSYKTSRETEQENSCEFETRQKVLRPDIKKKFMKRKASKSHLIKVSSFIKRTERQVVEKIFAKYTCNR